MKTNMQEYMKNRRQQRRDTLIEMAGSCCIICQSIESLEFDHIDAKTKRFQLSGKALDKPWTEILIEFNKCQLLCKPHHREKTVLEGETGGGHNKIENPQHGTAVLYNQKCRCEDCKLWKKLYRNNEVDSLGLPR